MTNVSEEGVGEWFRHWVDQGFAPLERQWAGDARSTTPTRGERSGATYRYHGAVASPWPRLMIFTSQDP